LKVAYLTMAYNSLLWYRKIFTVLWQDYPDDLKMHIISCQKSSVTRQFPKLIKHDLPFKIIQRYIEGRWPALWAFKMWDAVEVMKNNDYDVLIQLDEDDEFPPFYTKEVLKALVDSGADAVWSYRNIDAKNGSVMGYATPVEYDSAIGTLAIRRGPLEKATEKLRERYPIGRNKPHKGGALDAIFKSILHYDFNVVEHNVLRGYFRTPWTNSTRRPADEDIGRDFDYSNVRNVGEYKQSKFIQKILEERENDRAASV